jgi:hypothetical protein
MVEERRLPPAETASPVIPEPVEFPLRVAPDWDEQVRRGDRMAKLIDRHLDYEAYSRSLFESEQLTPIGLCPEQRVNLLTDMYAISSQTLG